jgi:hypothetical protein
MKRPIARHTQFNLITRLRHKFMAYKIWLQYLRYTCWHSTCRQARVDRRIMRKLIKALEATAKLGGSHASINATTVSDMRGITDDRLDRIVTELRRLTGVRVEGYIDGDGPELYISIPKPD